MATRSEREKCKKQHEKHLSILMELLREEDNKYCADCRAKGPRWASWNLGIFVCITCAGIHRNLGVHISKVKSVNLDAWTQEQITNMQEWGNRRVAQYYEYHLASDFKRPQGDSSLEQFIRSKYEKKLYICKDGPPPVSEIKETKKEKVKEKKKSADSEKKSQQISRPEVPKPVKSNPIPKDSKPAVKPSATEDLLSLSQPSPQQAGSTLLSMSRSKQEVADTVPDLLNFGPPLLAITGAPTAVQTAPNNAPALQPSQGFGFDLVQAMSPPVAPASNAAIPSSNGLVGSSKQNSGLEDDLIKDDLTGAGNQTKDSIMALYKPNQQQSNQQMFGVPGGVYLPQQQQPQQQQRQQNAVSPQYNAQFNMQQQQQQQMYQLNQVQQQMAKLGFSQTPQMSTNPGMQQNGQVMAGGPARQAAMPASQVMPGYNAYNQAAAHPGMTTPYHHNAPQATPYAPMGPPAGNWMPGLKTGTYPPQQQAQAQQSPYLMTAPSGQAFPMYQTQGGMPSGHTLSTNLWK